MKISLFSGPGTRRWPRFRLSDIPSISAVRSASGFRVDVVDISRGGALLLTPRRLAPGTSLRLNIITTEGDIPLSGFVLRSTGLGTRGALPFRTAVSFDRPLGIPDRLPHETMEIFQPVDRSAEEDTGTIAAFLAIDFRPEWDADMAEMLQLNDW
jgi:hypothetical protein